jgi:hypothetical protein
MGMWIERNFLSIFFLVGLLVGAYGVYTYAPTLPVLDVFRYGGLVVGLGLGAFLVSFLGHLTYFVGRNPVVEMMLEDSGALRTFLSTLDQPSRWGQAAILATLAYYASPLLGYQPLTGALLLLSLALSATTLVAIVRGLRLIRLFQTSALHGLALEAEVKDFILAQLEAQGAEEPTGPPESDTIH